MTSTTVPQGEITCLYTEFEGASALRKALPELEYTQNHAEQDALLCAAFHEMGGTVVDGPGDGFLVTFSIASKALRCAVLIQERLFEARDRLSVEAKDGKPQYPQVRIGIYTGWRKDFQTPDGNEGEPESNLAVCLGACGVGGQILVSQRTREQGDIYPADWWKVHPDRYLHDFDTSQTVYELLWDGRTNRPEPGTEWTPKFLLREGSSFVGRAQEIEAILRWMKGEGPLLWLHGQPGVGKSRLVAQAVLRAGHHYRGHIYGVPLDRDFVGTPEEATPLELAQDIALALDAPPTLQNSEKPEAILDYLERRFASDPFLLVLDSFEGVNNEATRAFLAALTQRVSQVWCLVVCREPLVAMEAESESLKILGLAVPEQDGDRLETFDAVRLFRERAQERFPMPDLSDTESLIRILRTTEGNPLAIELMAARCHQFSLRQIADGLQWGRMDWASLLDAESTPQSARPSRLESCIEWSYQKLHTEEWQRYPSLGLFESDFDSAAANTIADVPEELLRRWCRLHLVERSPETGRLFLPSPLREFAQQRLQEARLLPVQGRFIRHYAYLAQEHIMKRVPGHVIEIERRNLTTAADILCRREDLNKDEARTLLILGASLQQIASGRFHAYMRQVIRYYRSTLRVITEETSPRQWGQLQHTLGVTHNALASGPRTQNLHHAIACYEAALRVRTEHNFPREWAHTQFCLGTAYFHLPDGDRLTNLQRAIECFRSALRVYTEQSTPKEWANTQHNLGLACANLPCGDKTLPILNALDCYHNALRVYTESEFPEEWARTQNNLGNTILNLPFGSKPENNQEALCRFDAALQVYTEQDFPRDWAMVQVNRGVAYSRQTEGDSAANLREAIACYEVALRVYTEQDTPKEWALTQTNLGNAYLNLHNGDRSENLRQAIVCYEAALRVYTEQDFPTQWATAQNSMGAAYSRLPGKDRSANLQRAIPCYQAALRVRTEKDSPGDWAVTQNNLGVAYLYLLSGHRVANLTQAIDCFCATLRVRTEHDCPKEWAQTQYNLGMAYSELPSGARNANRDRAIACYRLALQVRTEQDCPKEWANTQHHLGKALWDQGRRVEALQAFALAARGYRQIGQEENAGILENRISLHNKALRSTHPSHGWQGLFRRWLPGFFRSR